MKAGVVLSGCGVMDGSEIHEAVLTMLCLDRQGLETVCMAPNENQADVVNHLTNAAAAGETRNILQESARIARGAVTDMAGIQAADIDLLIFPGGFGAAKNLCSFAADGAGCRVAPEAERLIIAMADAGKPIGALCIAPVLIARVLGGRGQRVQVTIGSDPGVAKAINAMGAEHVECPVNEAVIDRACRVATAPAYMLAKSIKDVADSAEALVRGLLELGGN
ncbi:isoprenoid biosynthesis glyoxalase ElbB [Thermodesulfobacteriota bacterium]